MRPDMYRLRIPLCLHDNVKCYRKYDIEVNHRPGEIPGWQVLNVKEEFENFFVCHVVGPPFDCTIIVEKSSREVTKISKEIVGDAERVFSE